jgi:hypothetical protein
MAEKETKQAATSQPDGQHELNFTYYKSNYFRVIHADGAWGGITPRGNIHISLYSERVALPDTSVVVVSGKTRQPVKPEKVQAKSVCVRELEVDVIMDLPTAISVRNWLTEHIDNLTDLIRTAQEAISDTD